MGVSNEHLGHWLVFGPGIAGAGLGIIWWRFPAAGWPGLALVMATGGILIAAAAGLALGQAFRVSPEPRAGAFLVRGGIYRWLRHPMYVGVILLILAAAIARPAWPVLVAALVNFAWYQLKASFEESRLRARYPEYEDYCHSTMGLPALPLRRKP